MIGDRRVLVVVPARGGSKGIPLKNLRTVGGVSLVARVGMVLRELPWVDRAVVSTDHEQIATEAEAAGIAAPFRRPASLSGDRIGDLEVLTHALLEMERLDRTRYDIVVMLQPTCPLRQPEHVTGCLDQLVTGGFDAVWTVSPSDLKLHPLKQLTLDGSGRLAYWDPAGGTIIARQQLEPVYHRNGAAYALTRSCLLDQQTIMGRRSGGVVIPDLISVDTEADLEKVERLLNRKGP